MTETSSKTIGVALSGGGVRAALFSLGVLIALTDTQLNRRVTTISSVSGGSIVNASVAQGCTFRNDDTSAFFASARALAEALCRRGAFMLSGAGLAVLIRRGSKLIAGVLSLIATLFIDSELFRDGGLSLSHWPIVPIALAAVGLVLVLLFLVRGVWQESVYASWLDELPRSDRKLARLRDLPDSTTTHVLVATDLPSGNPVYFSRNFVACPAFGWGEPGATLMASAVYASAAFPVGYPPRRFVRSRFRFQNGLLPPPYPRLMKLSDGGVYNNLGTDWLDELDHQSESRLWPFGNIPAAQVEPVQQRIIVNAGGGSGGLRKVWPLLSVWRVMSILYDNTVRPRLDNLQETTLRDLDAPLVINIGESPFHVSQRHQVDRTTDDMSDPVRIAMKERQVRAHCMADRLRTEARNETFWTLFARQTSTTQTKLTKAGVEPGARLMLHGYLSALVELNIVDNVPLPEVIHDEGYFLDLAGRKSHAESHPESQPST